MTLHVLIDGRTIQDQWDGIGRFVYHLVDRLAKRQDVKVTLLTTDCADSRLSASTLPANVDRIPFHHDVISLTSQRGWSRVVHEVAPDVVYVPYHLSAPLFVNVPVLIGIADCIFEADRRFAPNLWSRYGYMALTQAVITRAHGVVTVSDQSKSHLVKRYRVDTDRVHVVLPAADERFAKVVDDEHMAQVRRDLGLPDRYLLHVGARRPHKNIRLIIEAFSLLEPQQGDLGLVLVGSSDQKFHDEIPDLIMKLVGDDSVLALSGVPESDLPAVYHGAELVVYPSILEGYGFPPAEAMMAGIAVVASDGVPSVTELTGTSGPVVLPAHGAERWASAIKELLDNDTERENLAAAGAEAIRRHTWEDATDQFVDALGATTNGK